MKSTAHHDERIAQITFASVYPHYITKVERKGRTVEELHQVIEWLTGFDEKKLHPSGVNDCLLGISHKNYIVQSL